MNKIKSITFEDRIQVFLDYSCYERGSKFDFYLNKIHIGSTTKNHFLINNLNENTLYKVEIRKNGKSFAKKDIYTLPKREIINVPTSDGKILLTKELQNILDNASGRTVVFPEGIYLTGALFIKPNTHIKVCKNAVLLGSENPNDYLPKVKSRFEGNEMMCYASLLNIGNHNACKKTLDQNIYIYGEGEIRGGGKNLCEAEIAQEIPNIDESKVDKSKVNLNVVAGRARGRLFQISNSKNIVIEGLTLGYSPSWNIHTIYSKNIVICNCFIQSKDLHNGDGIDPDSTENMYIFNIFFATGDDCVAIKSGKNPDGNLINRPSKNIQVFDCKSKMGHGCCIGSEMSGGVKNIYFFDCDFEKTRYGVQIKTTKKRGGYIKNVYVEDLLLPAINIRTVPYNDDGEDSGKLAIFKNFHFKNITLSGVDVGNFGDEEIKVNHIEVKGFKDYSKCFSNMNFENISFKDKNNEKRIIIQDSTHINL